MLRERINELSRAFNATKTLEVAMADTLHTIHETLRRTNEKINAIAIAAPEIAITTSYMVHKISMANHLLQKLRYAYKAQRVDIQALSELINNPLLEDVEESSATALNFISPMPGAFKFDFLARRKSHDTKIYRVEAFRPWTNLTNSASLLEYMGSKYIIYNSTANCIQAISEPVQAYVTAKCSQMDYEDSRLSLWHVSNF